MGTSVERQRGHVVEVIAVAVLALAVSAPSLRVPFVWDDLTVIVRNEHLKNLANVRDLFDRSAYFARYGESSYRPLVTLSYFIDYQVGGEGPRLGLRAPLYHTENVALHVLCAVMVLLLARHVSATGRAPLVAGALFAAHPIVTEAVNAISFREDLQCAVLCLAALLAMRRALTSRHLWPWLIALFVSAAAAGFAKETALMLPVMAVALDLALANRAKALPQRRLIAYVTLIAAVGLYGFVRFIVMVSPEPLEIEQTVGRYGALLTFPTILVRYLRLIVFPIHQAAMHATEPVDGIGEMRLWLALVVGVAFVALAVAAWRRARTVGFGLTLFVIALVPVSGLVPLPNPIAERYLYLPMVGLSITVGAALFGSRAGQATTADLSRHLRGSLFLVMLGLLSLLAVHRTEEWLSDFRLWSSAREVTPGNLKVLNNLGKGYSREALLHDGATARGLLMKGVAEWERAARLWPADGMPLFNIGNTYKLVGRADLAVQYFRLALERLPRGPARIACYLRLSEAYRAVGDRVEARRTLLSAQSEAPDNPEIRQRLEALNR